MHIMLPYPYYSVILIPLEQEAVYTICDACLFFNEKRFNAKHTVFQRPLCWGKDEGCRTEQENRCCAAKKCRCVSVALSAFTFWSALKWTLLLASSRIFKMNCQNCKLNFTDAYLTTGFLFISLEKQRRTSKRVSSNSLCKYWCILICQSSLICLQICQLVLQVVADAIKFIQY